MDATLKVPGSYASYVLQDLSWLRHHADLVSSCPDPNEDLRPWLARALSPAWKSLIRKAARNHTFEFVDECKLSCVHNNNVRVASWPGLQGFLFIALRLLLPNRLRLPYAMIVGYSF